jgi:hypothetical protein
MTVDRYDQLDDVLGTAATTFLGVTLRCARCHDHKFEPFSQVDYYRMLAVFEPLVRPQNGRIELDRLAGTATELAAYEADTARADAEVARVWERIEALARPEIARLLAPGEAPKDGKPAGKRTALPADAIKAFQTEPARRSPGDRTLVKTFAAQLEAEVRQIAPAEVQAALKPLDERIAAINAGRRKEPPRAYIWYEAGPAAPATHILKRGDPTRRADSVTPGVPAVLVSRQPDPPRSTDRRAQ